MQINEQGMCHEARHIHSPNQDVRPVDAAIRLLIVHNVSLPPGVFGGDDVIRLFTNTLDIPNYPFFKEQGITELKVSAHFLIRRDGELIQFVSCNNRAWHAGISAWRDEVQLNRISVGVELEGTDAHPFTPIQYEVLAGLTDALLDRYPIEDIVGHSDVAPGRKTDPGPCFDWAHYRSLLTHKI